MGQDKNYFEQKRMGLGQKPPHPKPALLPSLHSIYTYNINHALQHHILYFFLNLNNIKQELMEDIIKIYY